MKKGFLMGLVIILSMMMAGCEFVNLSTNQTEITTNVDNEITYQLNPGVDTLLVGETWVDAGLTININGSETTIYSEDTININETGHYQVTYTYQELEENLVIQRNVSVIEEEDLQITLNPGIDTVYVGDDWIDAGATIDTDHQIQVTNDVDTLVAGTYNVIYYIEDETGIITQSVRIVHVINQ